MCLRHREPAAELIARLQPVGESLRRRFHPSVGPAGWIARHLQACLRAGRERSWCSGPPRAPWPQPPRLNSAPMASVERRPSTSAMTSSLKTVRAMTFANTIPGTVTGNSDTADYKDTVLAAFRPDRQLRIHHRVEGHGPGRAEWQLPLHRSPAAAPSCDLMPMPSIIPRTATAPQTQIQRTLTSHGDSETHTDLIAATDYTLVEGNVGPTFELVSIVCTVNGDTTGTDITAGGTFAVEVGKITRCSLRTGSPSRT